MKFSFVIPTYNNYKLLHQLLWDIYKQCSKPYEVIIADDGDDKETLDGIWWWKSMDVFDIKHFRQEENLGFLKNSNFGLRQATGDILCLISTDVRVHKDVVSFIETYSVRENPLHPFERPHLIGGRLLDYDTGWNSFDNKIFHYLEGWLLCTTKDTWERLGYFDERFAPNDYEDIDLSTTAIKMDHPLFALPEGYVSHIGAQTIGYTPEREALTQRNRIKFHDKWIK